MSVLGRAVAVALSARSNNFVFLVGYSTSTVDLRTAALAAGWDGTKKVVAVIPTGRIICPSTPGGYGSNGITGITIAGSFPNGVKLQLQPGSSLGGSRGTGGVQGVGAENGHAGGNGGTALWASVAVTVDNKGFIAGGGAGGGGGSGALKPDLSILQGGGGGDGQDMFFGQTNGNPGDSGYGGTYGGNGGTGGAQGSAGSPGNPGGSVSWDVWPGGYSGGSGGTGGNAVVGNSNITWENTGTRTGTVA